MKKPKKIQVGERETAVQGARKEGGRRSSGKEKKCANNNQTMQKSVNHREKLQQGDKRGAKRMYEKLKMHER